MCTPVPMGSLFWMTSYMLVTVLSFLVVTMSEGYFFIWHMTLSVTLISTSLMGCYILLFIGHMCNMICKMHMSRAVLIANKTSPPHLTPVALYIHLILDP